MQTGTRIEATVVFDAQVEVGKVQEAQRHIPKGRDKVVGGNAVD